MCKTGKEKGNYYIIGVSGVPGGSARPNPRVRVSGLVAIQSWGMKAILDQILECGCSKRDSSCPELSILATQVGSTRTRF